MFLLITGPAWSARTTRVAFFGSRSCPTARSKPGINKTLIANTRSKDTMYFLESCVDCALLRSCLRRVCTRPCVEFNCEPLTSTGALYFVLCSLSGVACSMIQRALRHDRHKGPSTTQTKNKEQSTKHQVLVKGSQLNSTHGRVQTRRRQDLNNAQSTHDSKNTSVSLLLVFCDKCFVDARL